MKFILIIFYTNKPTKENFEKTFSGYHVLNDVYLMAVNSAGINSEAIPIRKMTDIKDIYNLAAELNEHCIIAPFGVSFKKDVTNHFDKFDKVGLVTWGFEKNNIIYNKFSESIKANIIGISEAASKECAKDLNMFGALSTTHIPEILCNL